MGGQNSYSGNSHGTELNNVHEWRKTRNQVGTVSSGNSNAKDWNDMRWCPHPQGMVKVNVDPSVFPQEETFSIGMVRRDHVGTFIETKVMSSPRPDSILEAESIGVKEALSWVIQ